jgi:hypothetical protein
MVHRNLLSILLHRCLSQFNLFAIVTSRCTSVCQQFHMCIIENAMTEDEVCTAFREYEELVDFKGDAAIGERDAAKRSGTRMSVVLCLLLSLLFSLPSFCNTRSFLVNYAVKRGLTLPRARTRTHAHACKRAHTICEPTEICVKGTIASARLARVASGMGGGKGRRGRVLSSTTTNTQASGSGCVTRLDFSTSRESKW